MGDYSQNAVKLSAKFKFCNSKKLSHFRRFWLKLAKIRSMQNVIFRRLV
ncbi:hypothetical protein UNSWCD_1284 [Campylobacter concisus UNSWCD]|nr:hypothetical protein UNSWCD_1284 [Campylobacter concisus UNSWCD]